MDHDVLVRLEPVALHVEEPAVITAPNAGGLALPY
jgi:hypothetical protein